MNEMNEARISNLIETKLKGFSIHFSVVTNGAMEADDVLQEMVMEILKCDDSKPDNWLTNRAWWVGQTLQAKHGREYKRLRGIGVAIDGDGNEVDEFEVFSDGTDILEDIIEAESASVKRSEAIAKLDALQHALEDLSKQTRAVVELLSQGVGVSETGRKLGVTAPTVCYHRRLAREAMERQSE